MVSYSYLCRLYIFLKLLYYLRILSESRIHLIVFPWEERSGMVELDSGGLNGQMVEKWRKTTNFVWRR